MNINEPYFVSVTKPFSFKLCDKTAVGTEFVLLQSTSPHESACFKAQVPTSLDNQSLTVFEQIIRA